MKTWKAKFDELRTLIVCLLMGSFLTIGVATSMYLGINYCSNTTKEDAVFTDSTPGFCSTAEAAIDIATSYSICIPGTMDYVRVSRLGYNRDQYIEVVIPHGYYKINTHVAVVNRARCFIELAKTVPFDKIKDRDQTTRVTYLITIPESFLSTPFKFVQE